MTRWPCSSTCQASKALAIPATYRRRWSLARRTGAGWAFGSTAVPLTGGGRRRPRGRIRAGTYGDDLRGDGRAPRHRHSPRPAAAGLEAPIRARPRRATSDFAVNAAPGDYDARSERTPGLDAWSQGRPLRRRAPAAG